MKVQIMPALCCMLGTFNIKAAQIKTKTKYTNKREQFQLSVLRVTKQGERENRTWKNVNCIQKTIRNQLNPEMQVRLQTSLKLLLSIITIDLKIYFQVPWGDMLTTFPNP